METLNPRPGQSIFQTSSNPLRTGRVAPRNRQQIFGPRRNGTSSGADSPGGEGYQKLRNRLTSRGIPEGIIDELLEQPTIVSYRRGAFIFLQGAPTDLLFWVSSGLVDILSPGPEESRLTRVCLVPGISSDLLSAPTTKDDLRKPFKHALEPAFRLDS
jgi:hypothetical protein